MKNTTVAGLLRAALILCACAVLVVVLRFVPLYMAHVCAARPDLSPWYGWGVGFGWLLALPTFAALALLWQIFGTIGRGKAFVVVNAERFRHIWQLSAACFELCVGLGVFLWISQALPPFLTMTVLGLMFVTGTAGLASFALSGLCRSAALLREENEMTV